MDQKIIETSSGKKLDIHVISSLYHVEINPSDVGYYDKVVVQEVIKEIAQTQQVSSNAPREFKGI
jgi:replication factor C subunit 3/5